MSLSRTALALLLSALMGAPLCCCAYEVEGATAEQPSSCCHAVQSSDENQKQPEDHICACRSKEPREMAKELQLPGKQIADFAPPVMELIEPVSFAPTMAIVVIADHSGGDPPTRRRLARLSRWLN